MSNGRQWRRPPGLCPVRASRRPVGRRSSLAACMVSEHAQEPQTGLGIWYLRKRRRVKLDSVGSRRTVGTHGSVILAGFVGARCIGSRRVPGATRHMLPSQSRLATALRVHPPTPPPAAKRPFDHIKPQNNNSTDLEPGSVMHPHPPGATRAPGSGEPVRGRVGRKRPRRIDEVPNRLTGRGWSEVGG